MKRITYLLFLTFTLFSCKKEKTNTTIEVSDTLKTEIDSLTFEIKKFKRDTVVNQDTTLIEIEVPIINDKTIIADSINKLIFNQTRLLFDYDSILIAKNYDEICKNFIKSYKESLNEDRDFFSSWDGSTTTSIDYQSKNLINIVLSHWSFTGGAHGYGALQSYFINPKNGKQIKSKELFSDLIGFTKLAEQKFRKQQKVPMNVPINETGYWFENEKFHLSKNIFFTKKGIMLIYNQYEVASYAEGPIELLIPYKEADKFLKIK